MGNSSGLSGGGAIGADLNDCTLSANYAHSYGGGAQDCTLNRCMLTSNFLAGTSAGRYGGGADGCSLADCTLTGNSAYWGGGAANGTLDNCTLTSNSAVWGGGIDGCTLNNCTLTGNSATGGGGGAYISFLNNCLLAGNQAAYGGGAYQSSLTGCTVVNNSASSYGGGTEGGSLNNCIAYYNTAPDFPNYDGSLNNCCAVPLPGAGSGNFTNAPLLVAPSTTNYHLQSNSPCINAGRNFYVSGATDLAGNPRIVAGTVDVGAYEFQTPSSRISYAWLQQYGLPLDDSTDTDGDGMNNWQEWIAGTDPTSADSVLRLQPPAVALPGLVLRWSSDTSHTYFVESATNLDGPQAFSLLGTNIPGLAGTTTYTDTSALSQPAVFYRVGTDSTSGSASMSLQLPVWFSGSATLTWSSVATRSYTLEKAMNVGATPAFSLLSSNIAGLAGTTSFTDTNALTGAPCFYRIRVEQ
jgi:hypothetical protein